MRLRTVAHTETGLVRANNEDHFLVAELSKAMRVRQSSLAQPKTQFVAPRHTDQHENPF